MHKIALGTAQFGFNYGINNKRGQVPKDEVFKILNRALEVGIDTVDTAYSYGNSEKILGSFMKSYQKKLKIISKLPVCEYDEAREIFIDSLNNLGMTTIYGYLIHSFENYKKDPKIWDELEKLRKDGKVEKIGFSFYFPTELEYLLNKNLKIDIIQIPYSIFDRRFDTYLEELTKRKIEVYVRSVFLQGLVFKDPNSLNGIFLRVKDKIEEINTLSNRLNVSRVSLCVNFVTLNKFIDKVIIGVDSLDNFNEIVKSIDDTSKIKNAFDRLNIFQVNDEGILLPFKWKKNLVV